MLAVLLAAIVSVSFSLGLLLGCSLAAGRVADLEGEVDRLRAHQRGEG